jgi:hypothetical protein
MSRVVFKMMDYQPLDDQPEDIGEEKFWTLRRIILTIIVLITLIAFLAYILLSNYAFVSRPQPSAPTLEVQRG